MKLLLFFLTAALSAQQVDLQRNVRGILPFKNGGTGVGIATANTILVSNGTSWVVTSVPSCPDTGGNHLNFSGGTLSCGTSGGASITSVFGRTGVVIAVTGDYTAAQVTNAVDATASYANPSWITSLANAKITGLATVATSGSASDLGAGTLPAARLPNPTLTTAGGVRAKLCGAGNHVININADTTIDCAADTGGSLTPTGPFQYYSSLGDGTTAAFHNPVAYLVSDFDYTPIAPGGSLTGGIGATVSVSNCPRGVSGSASRLYQYLTNGTGTAEPVLITGGTCNGDNNPGTLIFTPANNHSGAWTIQSDSGGLREAILYANGNATLILDANRTINVAAKPGISFDKANMKLVGSGQSSVIKFRNSANGNTILAATACDYCIFEDFKLDGNRSNTGMDPTNAVALALGTTNVGGANHVRVRNVEITGSASGGIILNDTNIDVEIASSFIHDNGGVTNGAGNGVGIFVYHAGGTTAANNIRILNNAIYRNYNTITNSGSSSCIAFQSTNTTVAYNHCFNNYQTGGGQIVASHYDTTGYKIDNNTIEMTPTGLVQVTSGIESDSANGTISNNTIKGHLAAACIALEGNALGPGGVGATNTSVVGNTCSGNTGITLNNAGGKTTHTTLTGNVFTTTTALFIDSATVSTVVTGNDFSGSTTVYAGTLTDVRAAGNLPGSADYFYTGVASANTIATSCGKVLSLSGGVTVKTLTEAPGSTGTAAAGCTVTLIPIIGSTWVTDATGNIGKASAPVPGVPIIFTSDGTKYWPSY